MGLTLTEALAQVDLEAGRTYRCQVNGRWVEVRVLESAKVLPSCRYDESDVMLDPWVEFPLPAATMVVRAKLGVMPLPDAPEIPADEDEP
jgi:hypothetical protein